MNIARVILAAGTSSRAGDINKLLQEINGQSLLRRTILTAPQYKTTIVTGHQADEITSHVADLDVTIVHNQHYKMGMGTSIAAGIKAVIDHCDYAFIALADMPLISTTTYEQIIKAATNLPNMLAYIPTHNTLQGHPVLWHKSAFDMLMDLDGDYGGKIILQENAHAIIKIETDDPSILKDFDTVASLEAF